MRCATLPVITTGVLLVSGAVLASPSRTDDAGLEKRARSIERLLTAPCCFKGTLEDHASAQAGQMRQEIRAFLRQGKTKRQILSHYRERYGEAILVEPPQGGLSALVLYGIPFGLFVVGVVVTAALMARRGRGRQGSLANEGSPPSSLPPEMEARIDALVDGRESARR